MPDFTRRQATNAIAASAVIAPITLTAHASTDGAVAALVKKRAELWVKFCAADNLADERRFALPDEIRRPRVLLSDGHPIGPQYAHSREEIARYFDRFKQEALATKDFAGFLMWAQINQIPGSWTADEMQSSGPLARERYFDNLAKNRAAKLAEYEQAEARTQAAKDAAGVTDAEAEAARIDAEERATVQAIIDTPSGGPRDLLAKLSMLEITEGSSEAYWHGDILESLRRDLQAVGA
ncbi:MAG: hypothetical protein RIA64_01835 [Rhodospirillales bacterium]